MSMQLKLKIFNIFVLAPALTLALFSCTQSGETPPDITTLYGPYTATGTITATEASLTRRGTHILLVQGRPLFYLESKTVNLSEFEEKQASVQGELMANTKVELLPVIVVSTVTAVKTSAEEVLESYTVPVLALSLKAPKTWKSTLAGGRLSFTAPMEETPFIAIEKSTLQVLPEGVPIRIGGRNGVRTVEKDAHRILVMGEGDSIILFTFGPKGPESTNLRDAFYTMLQSVHFTGASSSRSSSESEFKGSKQPCGGSAGVLCPSGEFCDVREMDTGIGVCRAL